VSIGPRAVRLGREYTLRKSRHGIDTAHLRGRKKSGVEQHEDAFVPQDADKTPSFRKTLQHALFTPRQSPSSRESSRRTSQPHLHNKQSKSRYPPLVQRPGNRLTKEKSLYTRKGQKGLAGTMCQARAVRREEEECTKGN
jgi:hypothetical protein